MNWENNGQHAECDHKHGECHVTDEPTAPEPLVSRRSLLLLAQGMCLGVVAGEITSSFLAFTLVFLALVAAFQISDEIRR